MNVEGALRNFFPPCPNSEHHREPIFNLDSHTFASALEFSSHHHLTSFAYVVCFGSQCRRRLFRFISAAVATICFVSQRCLWLFCFSAPPPPSASFLCAAAPVLRLCICISHVCEKEVFGKMIPANYYDAY